MVFLTQKRTVGGYCVKGAPSLPGNNTFTITCSATHFVELGARISLKVATKGSPGGKKTLKI